MHEQDLTETSEAATADNRDELNAVREALAESRARALAAVERLKVALLASEPTLEPAMLSGETTPANATSTNPSCTTARASNSGTALSLPRESSTLPSGRSVV